MMALKLKIVRNLWIALMIFLFSACSKPYKAIGDSPLFLTTLTVHLDAIKNSNLEKLEPTVSDQVAMIGPNGHKYDSKEVFMDFHKKWFAMNNWEWQGNVLSTESNDSLGYALIQYRFVQKDSLGNVQFQDNEYLVLIFKNLTSGWQLVHDQNTAIQELNTSTN